MKEDYIGENIRIYRQKAKLTQQELAKKVGVSWEMISRYERNVSSPLSRIDVIAKALNVTPNHLLQNSYIPNESQYLSDPSRSSQIPIHNSIPNNFDFTKSSKLFYACPQWIIDGDEESFLVAENLYNSKSVEIKNDYPIYISPSLKPGSSDYVLLKKNEELIIKKYEGEKDVIGVVVAQEYRFR